MSLLLSLVENTEKAEHEKEAGIGEHIMHHIKDAHTMEFPPFGEIHLPQFPPINIGGFEIDISITKHTVVMWFVGVVMILLFGLIARSYRKSIVPGRFANAFEVLILFIRDQVAIPNMGEKLGRAFTPYLLTLFFFILFSNLIGMVPYGTRSTGNISVTGALAVLTFILTIVLGLKEAGFKAFLKSFTGGTPPYLWIMIVPIEIIGFLSKHLVLAIRLFANMAAGEMALLALLGIIILFKAVVFVVAPVSLFFALFIGLLEIFVAFLQAYIFVMLSSLFIGMSAHPHH
jgi:F-type H+-transporting ATPase subunit a